MFSNTQTNQNQNKYAKIRNQLEALNNDNNSHFNNSKDKFDILNDKILSISENKNAKNFKNIIEGKINEVKENFKTNIDSLQQKYSILNSQMSKFNSIIEEEKLNKEKNKIQKELELKQLEEDIKNILSQERSFMKSYIDEYTKKIEDIIINHTQEIKEENEDKINNIKNITADIGQKFGEIKENIETQKQKREEIENEHENNISEIMEKIKNEIDIQKQKREEFEANAFTIIEDTCIKLAENNS